ncbi:uncharacterized protein LOC113280497 [Papaver somniferum]|uniref:uncharacterized protein LOC113280497 n=1 Tax=Papaver somniferum TaxID=3469 RepID=UPI000E6FA33F|nr:uncharacterized protein LOC113280497 [Papaver somniferum]
MVEETSKDGEKGKQPEHDLPKKNPVYHLGSSDGHGILITLISLKGTNYDEWARAIRRSLIAKRKFGFVDGTIKEPTNPEQLEEWIAVQSMVVSWINNTMDSSIRSMLGDYDDASVLWTHLMKRFCVVSGTRICQLKSALSNYPARRRLSPLLIGLDGMYSSLREQLLARDPLPTIDAAYQAVVNSERLRMGDVLLSKEAQENVMTFKVQQDQTTTTSTYDATKFCKHCNRVGHSEDGCFQIIGYPEWWGERSRGGSGVSSGSRGVGRGGKTGGRGHAAHPYNGTTSADGAGLVGVTATQLQQVLDYLSSNKSKFHLQGLPDGKFANSEKIGTVILPGGLKLHNVLYVPQITFKVLAVRGDSYELWHQRMGHPAEKVLQKIPTVSRLVRKNNDACDIFPRAKHRRSSFPNSKSKAICIFELVHLDLWGPYKTPSSCGAHYFLTIVDDFSRGVWIYLIKNKTEVELVFLNFIALIKRQFNKEIKNVRSDNGTEFNTLLGYFQTNEIIFETSCVGTPQQNGRVERKHQHIMNVARALRFQANFPIQFWGECALTAAYLINRTPTPILNNKTPYEIMFGKVPPYDQLKVFGCLCYVHNQNSKGDKFASRGRRCVFLGYPFGKKAWQVYDLDTKQFLVSIDVDFYEHQFPYIKKNVEDSNNIAPSSMETCWSDDEDGEEVRLSREVIETQQPEMQQQQRSDETKLGIEGATEELRTSTQEHSEQTEQDDTSNETSGKVMIDNNISEMGKGKRQKIPSSILKGFVTHTVCENSPPSTQPTQSSSSGTPYPLTYYVSCDRFSAVHRKYLAAINAEMNPRASKKI